MNILVTGAKGFIGKNLVVELKNQGYRNIFEYDKETDESLLDEYCKKADFVYHLAGVNRPKDTDEFMKGNHDLTAKMIEYLTKHDNQCPVMMSSSIQADLDNPYGKSKKAGEEVIFEYGKQTGSKVMIYRFPNVFGKWSRPNYNSVVSTFCYNIAHDKEIQVNDENVELTLVFIDDVVNELINALEGNENKEKGYCYVPVTHSITLGQLAEVIQSFRHSRDNLFVPDMSNALVKKLYATYLSYLPKEKFSYYLKMNTDERGSFTEFIKSVDRGQVSVNVSKPGITKGNHWHHTKNEKFLVVSGKGVIRFRDINSDEVLEYFVSDEQFEVVDIPVGYTHNIENLGNKDMVTIMWANEPFDPNNPDTYYEEV